MKLEIGFTIQHPEYPERGVCMKTIEVPEGVDGLTAFKAEVDNIYNHAMDELKKSTVKLGTDNHDIHS